jgi:hypothetical protein
MILSLKVLAAAGLAASVATGGAIATQAPSSNPPAAIAGPADPAEVLTMLAVGEEARFSASDAGEVVILRTPDGLEVKSVVAAAGWLQEIEEATGDEVEVTFRISGRRVDLNIELEDGSLRVRVRQRLDDDGLDDDNVTTTTVPTTATTGATQPTTSTTFDDDRGDRITTSTTLDDDRFTTSTTLDDDRLTTSTTFDDDRFRGDDDDNSGPGGDDDNSGPGGGDDDHSGSGHSGSDDH